MHSRVALPGIFGLVVLSFVAATAFVHWEMSAIDDAALEIADDAAPGIEDLATARSDLRTLTVALRHNRTAHVYDATHVEDSRRIVDRAVEGYLKRPILPGDRKNWDDVHRTRERLDATLLRYERAARSDDAETVGALDPEIMTATGELGDAITAALEASAARARESALRIRHLRSQSSHVAVGLDVVCTLIALLGAWLVHRIARADRESREGRAKEMEDFAGRIAHDILSPLGAISFALDLVKRTDDPKQRERITDRGISSLDRIQRLVAGLLEFARAGGKPTSDVSADVGRTIADLVAELSVDAEAKRVQLTSKQEGDLVAACNPGVLTSLVANLARNAMKYLGDAKERRIEIRAAKHGRCVRVEVEDTGPGLPPSLAKRVFDPYVRAANTNEAGIGLGLATVKRLAEAHGGTVGVTSEPGNGATFWFELPLTG